MKIIENSSILAHVTGHLSRVAARWSLERSERSSRGGGIGARGRPRRPSGQKHVRNVVIDVVPILMVSEALKPNFWEIDQNFVYLN